MIPESLSVCLGPRHPSGRSLPNLDGHCSRSVPHCKATEDWGLSQRHREQVSHRVQVSGFGVMASVKVVKAEGVSVTRADMRQQLDRTLQHKPAVTGSPSSASPGGIKTPAHPGAASPPPCQTPNLPSLPREGCGTHQTVDISLTPYHSSPS